MDRIFKVGLIDDEVSALRNLREIIDMIPEFEVGFETTDPNEGLSKILSGEADILITDVVIPNLGGLSISEKLKDTGIPIIFCSAHDRFAVSGYQLNAAYFILKPAFYTEVSKALHTARIKLESSIGKPFIGRENIRLINGSGGVTGEMIDVSEIVFLEQSANVTTLHFIKDKKFVVSSLTNFLKGLKYPHLVRVHKSFAVNILLIKKINFTQITLKNDQKIPLGRGYREGLNDYFSDKIL